LRSEQLDMVSVATAGVENGSHHHKPAMQALAAGKHVLVEKPISNNLAEAKEMVAEARRRGVCLAVDLNHRFTPATRLAKEKITSGALGEVLFVNMNLWIRNPKDDPQYLPPARLALALGGRDAPPGRRCRPRAGVLPQRPGPADLEQRQHQHAVHVGRPGPPDG